MSKTFVSLNPGTESFCFSKLVVVGLIIYSKSQKYKKPTGLPIFTLEKFVHIRSPSTKLFPFFTEVDFISEKCLPSNDVTAGNLQSQTRHISPFQFGPFIFPCHDIWGKCTGRRAVVVGGSFFIYLVQIISRTRN